MAYKVEMNVPQRPIGKTDVEFVVDNDGMVGRLKVSKGGVDWKSGPGARTADISFTWAEFDRAMKAVKEQRAGGPRRPAKRASAAKKTAPPRKRASGPRKAASSG